MKKRLISIILTNIMVLQLFASNAFASGVILEQDIEYGMDVEESQASEEVPDFAVDPFENILESDEALSLEAMQGNEEAPEADIETGELPDEAGEEFEQPNEVPKGTDFSNNSEGVAEIENGEETGTDYSEDYDPETPVEDQESDEDYSLPAKSGEKKFAAPQDGNEELQLVEVEEGNGSAPKYWGSELMHLDRAKELAEELVAEADEDEFHYTVAVIDTGVDTSHEVFNGRNISEVNIAGVDTVQDKSAYDHGTHVAGIIAHNTPASVDLVSIKALNNDGSGTAQSVVQAIQTAWMDYDADIINLSLSLSFLDTDDEMTYSNYKEELEEAITDAIVNGGCVVIVSAGNDGSEILEAGTFPASLDDVITVGALSASDNHPCFGMSNYGNSVDFWAPGEDIYSAKAGTVSGYQYLSGTSMAASFVSAFFADLMILYGYDREADIPEDLMAFFHKHGGTELVTDTGGNNAPIPVFSDGLINKLIKGCISWLYDLSISYADKVGNAAVLEWEFEKYGEEYKPKWAEFYIWRSIDNSEKILIGATKSYEYVDTDIEAGHDYTYTVEIKGNNLLGNGFQSDSEVICTDDDGEENTIVPFIIESTGKRAVNIGETKEMFLLELDEDNPEGCEIRLAVQSGKDGGASLAEAIYDKESGLISIKGLSEGRDRLIVSIELNGTLLWTDDTASFTVQDPENAEDITDGTISWTFDETEGVLTILGEGEMDNYGENDKNAPPWYKHRAEIRELEIGEDITGIGDYAFRNLYNLSSVEGMGSVKSIGIGAFKTTAPDNETVQARSMILPEGLESVGEGAFDGCIFSEFSIPSSLIVGLGDGEPDPEDYSFLSATTIEHLEVAEDNPYFSFDQNLLFDANELYLIKCITSVRRCYVPDSVMEIGTSAFENCRLLEYVSLPDGLEKINESAFANTALQELSIPGSVELVCANILNGCAKLKKIVFRGFTIGLKNAMGGDAYKRFIEKSSGGPLYIDASGKTGDLIWKAEGESGNLILTLSGNGSMPDYQIEDVPWYDGKEEIRKVVVEHGVTKVGQYAFYQCRNLETVMLTESVADYGSKVFRGDIKLKTYDFSTSKGARIVRITPGYTLATYYDGFEFRPDIMAVTEDGSALKNGQDFVTEYIVTSGEGTKNYRGIISIQFKANFADSGTVCIPFEVTSEDIKGDAAETMSRNITLSKSTFIYSGDIQLPEVKVHNINGNTLIKDKDYKLDYSNKKSKDVQANPYTVQVIGIGGYKGCYSEIENYRITARNIKNISISVNPNKPYTGSPIVQEPLLKLNGHTLKKGTDYTVSYKNHTNVGRASIIIKGKGNLTGEITKFFSIQSRDITNNKYISINGITDQYYTGKWIYQYPTSVKYKGKNLVKNRDYTISTQRNKAVGTAKIEIVGKGNFSGRRTVSYRIRKKEQPMRVRRRKSVNKAPYRVLREHKGSFKLSNLISVKGSKGTVKYKILRRSLGARKIKIIKKDKTYRLSLPKGLSKGDYYVTIKVTAGGNKYYEDGYQTVTVHVKVA